MRALFRKYQAYCRRTDGRFFLRTTTRIISIVTALVIGSLLQGEYIAYAFFSASLLLEIIFFKVLKLRESSYKDSDFFTKQGSTPKIFDRYKATVLNWKICLFVIAHSLFFIIPEGAPLPSKVLFIGLFYGVLIMIVSIIISFKYGYLEFRPGEGKNKGFPVTERKTGYGLPGYVAGVYTGDSRDIGT
ncbi:MAG: hypothetical protein K2X53_05255 [Alphaproteobacteria bacterium]|nr:hypothetical protein [Alphaproteobacteria bacterium]